MDELGNVLREAREMKGLTLAEVQSVIRINARYLEALEAGDYHNLPTPVHVRGFLRNYARFLDLDPAPLLERYEASRNHRPLPVPTRVPETVSPQEPLPPRSDQPFFDPVNVGLDGSVSGAESRVRLVIIVALLITIGLAASRFLPLLLGQGDGRDNLPQMIESLMAVEEEPEATPSGAGSNVPLVTSQPITPTERNNPEAVATGDSVEAVAPTPPQLPATMERIDLRLDITERTWLRVTIDGEVVLEDQVTREEGPFEWEAATEAHLLTGNAAGVFITINDVEIGKLGGRGEVREQTWTTTGN